MYFKDFRERLELTQKQIAEIVQTTPSLIAKYESDKILPNISLLLKYVEKLNANPNFILLGIEPHLLSEEDYVITQTIREFIRDLSFITTTEDLTFELRNLLLKKTVEKLISSDGYEKSSFEKFMEAIKFEGHIPFRPALFVYYMFRYIVENLDELNSKENYKDYLIELIKRYKIKSLKNNPIFTNRIKKIIVDNLIHNLVEKDCKLILSNPKITLEILESKMTSSMVLAHKFIDTKSLFPPLEK
jgi:transcriptional regulator with XRE-family HTH domain